MSLKPRFISHDFLTRSCLSIAYQDRGCNRVATAVLDPTRPDATFVTEEDVPKMVLTQLKRIHGIRVIFEPDNPLITAPEFVS